jgi:hypothetical protein
MRGSQPFELWLYSLVINIPPCDPCCGHMDGCEENATDPGQGLCREKCAVGSDTEGCQFEKPRGVTVMASRELPAGMIGDACLCAEVPVPTEFATLAVAGTP